MSGKINSNTNSRLKLVTINEIKEESINWLWKPLIAFGKICLVQGDAGIGKSTAVLSIAADMTNGQMSGESDLDSPANVIYQTAEDCYSDTVKPRLQRLGADCGRVYVIDDREYPLSLADDRIEQAIAKTGAKLFIADPLQGFCKGADINSVGGMRPLMKHLANVAERTGCAIILISHLNKKSTQSQYRGMGSVDIYAAARSVLTVGKLPLDENMRVIVNTKNNLAPLGKSQAFAVDESGGLVWLGDCDATTDDILSGKTKSESQFAKAKRLLETKLSGGMAVPAVQIMDMADNEGISFRTFKRAKELLGVVSFKRGGQWFWQMPIDVVYEECQSEEGQNEQDGQANALVPIDFIGEKACI